MAATTITITQETLKRLQMLKHRVALEYNESSMTFDALINKLADAYEDSRGKTEDVESR